MRICMNAYTMPFISHNRHSLEYLNNAYLYIVTLWTKRK